MVRQFIGPIGVAYAIKKTFDGMNAAVDASQRMKSSLIGLETVARAFKQDQDEAKKAAVELAKDGLLTVGEAAMGLKNLLSRMKLEDAIRLMNGLKDSAAFNRQGFFAYGESIVRTTEGIKNLISNTADAAGITKNLNIIMKEQGFTLEDLDKADRKVAASQALVNGFIKETSIFAGDSKKILEELGGQKAKVKSQAGLLAASIGDLLTPAYQKFTGVLGYLIEDMQVSIDQVKTLGTNYLWLQNQVKYAARAFEGFWVKILQGGSAMEALMGAETAVSDAMEEDFKKGQQPIKDVTDTTNNAAKAVSEYAKKLALLPEHFKDIGEKEEITFFKGAGGKEFFRINKEFDEQQKAHLDMVNEYYKALAENRKVFFDEMVTTDKLMADLIKNNDVTRYVDEQGQEFYRINSEFEEQQRVHLEIESEYYKALAEGARKYYQDSDKAYVEYVEQQKSHIRDQIQIYAQYGEQFGQAIADAVIHGRDIFKEAAKQMLDIGITMLEKKYLEAQASALLDIIISGGALAPMSFVKIAAGYAALETARVAVNNWQMGASNIPRTQTAIVHQGERILSNVENKEMIRILYQINQKLDRTGGGDTYHINAIDAQSFQQFMRRTGYGVIQRDMQRGRFNG